MVDQLLENSLDMVNGARVPVALQPSARARARQSMLTGTVALIFGDRLKDMLSGYRVMSRRFVKSFPALAAGFETETELTVHALELRLPLAEVQTRIAIVRRLGQQAADVSRRLQDPAHDLLPGEGRAAAAVLLGRGARLLSPRRSCSVRPWSPSSSGPGSCRDSRRPSWPRD
jgi:hypothetical protein